MWLVLVTRWLTSPHQPTAQVKRKHPPTHRTPTCTQATFAAARSGLPLVHPTKPGVTAVRCLPILPDLDAWPNKYVTVVFEEGDPANDARAVKRVR